MSPPYNELQLVYFRGSRGASGAVVVGIGVITNTLPPSQLKKVGSIKAVDHKRSILLEPCGKIEVGRVDGRPHFAGVGVSISIGRELEWRIAEATIATAFGSAQRYK